MVHDKGITPAASPVEIVVLNEATLDGVKLALFEDFDVDQFFDADGVQGLDILVGLALCFILLVNLTLLLFT